MDPEKIDLVKFVLNEQYPKWLYSAWVAEECGFRPGTARHILVQLTKNGWAEQQADPNTKPGKLPLMQWRMFNATDNRGKSFEPVLQQITDKDLTNILLVLYEDKRISIKDIVGYLLNQDVIKLVKKGLKK